MADREFTDYTVFTLEFTLRKWLTEQLKCLKVKRVNSFSTFLGLETKLIELIIILTKKNSLFLFTLFTLGGQTRISPTFRRVKRGVNSYSENSPNSPWVLDPSSCPSRKDSLLDRLFCQRHRVHNEHHSCTEWSLFNAKEA